MKPMSSATEVKLLEETPAAKTPAASEKPEATEGETTEGEDAKPSEGRSVSKSEVNVSDEGTVEIHVNDASLVEVLRMLSLQSQKNIICSKDVRGTVTANLYDVTVKEAHVDPFTWVRIAANGRVSTLLVPPYPPPMKESEWLAATTRH